MPKPSERRVLVSDHREVSTATSVVVPLPGQRGITLEELRGIGLFGALPEATLEEWTRSLVVQALPGGVFVVREGENARDMYVILDGEMEVLRRSRSGSDARVALLGPGDWFGEMSILDIQPRSASVRTIAPASVLVLTAADFDQLYRKDLRAYALLVMNLAREMSRRLRVSDGIVADLIANVVGSYLTPNARIPK